MMAYKVTDECLACEACIGECPVGCISMGDDKAVIDADSCLECGACAGTCPAEAIVLDN